MKPKLAFSFRSISITSLLVVGFIAYGALRFGQAQKPTSTSQDLIVYREIIALRYPDDQKVGVKFQGTFRLPRASGEATVHRKKGMSEINLRLNDMKPASLFGGDFNTYLLWIVSPEGVTDNGGEVTLKGNKGEWNVSTPLQTFGTFVTAEPHFLVRSPSRFIVLENTRPTQVAGPHIEISQIKYRGFEGAYNFGRETLANAPDIPEQPASDLAQARAAVRLAEQAGAERYAPQELEKAREVIRKAETMAATTKDKNKLVGQGREAVRFALEAQMKAENAAAQRAMTSEVSSSAETGRSAPNVHEKRR